MSVYRMVTANGCGEVLIDGTAKYKYITVGTETIDPATIPTEEPPGCLVRSGGVTEFLP